jgi:hypothetical protein
MSEIIKVLGNHEDLGNFEASIYDDGTAMLEIDSFLEYGIDELQALIDALGEVKAELEAMR